MVQKNIFAVFLSFLGLWEFSGRLYALEHRENQRIDIALKIIKKITCNNAWYEHFLNRIVQSHIAPNILEAVLVDAVKELVQKGKDNPGFLENIKDLYAALEALEDDAIEVRAPRPGDLPPAGTEVLFTPDFLQVLEGSVAGVFVEDVGSASPSGGILNIHGGSNINTSGGGSTVTINLNASPSITGLTVANTSTFNGTVLINNGGTVTGSWAVGSLVSAATINTTNGSITIGSTAPNATASDLDFTKDRGVGVSVHAGDALGNITFQGLDGTGTFIVGSKIVSITPNGAVAPGQVSSDLEFFTHPNSPTPSTQRMVIGTAGNVTINTPDSGAALIINGGGLTSTGTTTLGSLPIGVVQASATGVLSSSAGADGQVLIGAGTSASPVWANLTSSNGTITITNGAGTINLATSSATANSFVTNSGTATPAAGVLTVVGDGSNITTSGATSTVTVSLSSSPSVSGSLTAGTSISAGTTVTAGSGITATNGNIAASSGSVAASSSISAGTTVTGGTGVTATTGNITASAGNLVLPATNAAGTQGVISLGGITFVQGVGTHNAFFGGAGDLSLTGTQNVGLGSTCLVTLSSGSNNTGVGVFALQTVAGGNQHTAIGANALTNIASGTGNVGLGYNAGSSYTANESYNISIGFDASGTGGESNTLRIGNGTGTGTGQINQTFVSGITGITVTGAAVLVSATNQLGIAVSTIKEKENIVEMGNSSEVVYELNPVFFTYIKDALHTPQWGLIAEEVQEVAPELVILNDKSEPMSVRYHDLPVLLLNEMKNQRTRSSDLRFQAFNSSPVVLKAAAHETTLVFDMQEHLVKSSYYNPAISTYTVPSRGTNAVSGVYRVSFSVRAQSAEGMNDLTIALQQNGSTPSKSYVVGPLPITTAPTLVSGTWLIFLNPGDSLNLTYTNSGTYDITVPTASGVLAVDFFAF